jgi:hypothetical protein
MTFEQFCDAALAGLGQSALATIIAVLQIGPPIVTTIVVVFLFARLMKVDSEGENILLHGSTFGFIGLIVAYLYAGRNESIISDFLPHFIAAAALAFQLVGRLKDDWNVPIESQSTVAAAAATAFCFLFGSVYFESIRPEPDNSRPEVQSSNLIE